MYLIILGLVFSFMGLVQIQNQPGTAMIFITLGLVNIGVGIYQIVKRIENNKFKEEECKAIYEKLIVYNKAHTSTGVIATLEPDTHFFVNRSNEFGDFLQIRFNEDQSGYISKSSKFIKIE